MDYDCLIFDDEGEVFLKKGAPGKLDRKATRGIQLMEAYFKMPKAMRFKRKTSLLVAYVILPLLLIPLGYIVFTKVPQLLDLGGEDLAFSLFMVIVVYYSFACFFMAPFFSVSFRMYYYRKIPQHLERLCEKMGISYRSMCVDVDMVRGGGSRYIGWGSSDAIATAATLTLASAALHGAKNVDTNFKNLRIAIYISYNNVADYFIKQYITD